jgi:hypothetical protein
MRIRNLLSITATLLLLFLFTSCDTDSATEPGETEFSFNHEINPGQSAPEFLTDENFERLVVQVQYMQGYEPTQQGLNNLKTFLSNRLNKTSITIMEPEEIPASGESSYTANDIRDLEREHRTQFSSENEIVAYFIVVDGEFSDADVLGIAHFNTSMALFGPMFDEVSGGIGSPPKEDVETIVMQHEFGHILGLVNNGVDMQNNHQDTENGRHCDNEECLMNYAFRNANLFANIFGGNIPELDENCVADLQAAGGK